MHNIKSQAYKQNKKYIQGHPRHDTHSNEFLKIKETGLNDCNFSLTNGQTTARRIS